MKSITLYAACTIDGYIARPDGSLDWLFAIPNPEKTDHGYNDLLEKTSCIIMGRKTYSWLLDYGEEWPYGSVITYIASNDGLFKPSTPNTKKLSGDIAAAVRKIRSETDGDIWLVGGGQLVSYFLNNDLIDKMIISIVPLILGEGIALFPEKTRESKWILKDHTSYPTGIINVTFERETE